MKTIGWHMLDEEILSRSLARAGLDRWLNKLRRPKPSGLRPARRDGPSSPAD